MSQLSYLQAIVIGLLQGVTELFPVSSLGHSVLVPALIGGSWHHLVTQSSTKHSEQSPYLAFIVALHVATALALLTFYWRDWVRIITALLRSIRTRTIEGADARLGWLLVVATIPAGITGLALEHELRTLFAKPVAAAAFLTVNGFILLAGERFRRKAPKAVPTRAAVEEAPAEIRWQRAGGVTADEESSRAADAVLAESLNFKESFVIGLAQTAALLAGISRSGITMVAGLARGLDHESAARFAFLLATPIILAAGVLKLPTLAGSAGDGIRSQVVVGSIVSGIAAYIAIRFLTRYFERFTLRPFGIYCLLFGTACLIRFA